MTRQSTDIYKRLVQLNDEQVRYAIEHQVSDPSSRHYGGIVNEHTGIPSPSHGGTAGFIASLASAVCVPESRCYSEPQTLTALEQAVDYMLNRQHADGTISLGGTNFHSPPDTSFVVAGMCQVYRLLASRGGQRAHTATAKVRTFLERTIPALTTGGCHTPNHRWVMTAALASLHNIFGRQELVDRANVWLAEGMDCTEDGEWTERSNGIYNTVSNIMLYYTAQYLDRPELLDHVRRNLKMMVYMVHHDGEVVTDYSDRQDFGLPHYLSEYFLSYRLMAEYDRDPLFASMYDASASTLKHLGPVNNHALLGYLSFPCEHLDELDRAPLPEQYEETFNATHPIEEHLAQMEQAGHHSRILHSRMHTAFGAPVVRYRDQDTSVTMMARTSSFFSLRHGKVKLHGIRLSSLFSPGIVHMDTLKKDALSYKLQASMEKGYNAPLAAENLPQSAFEPISPWYLLPHQKRELTHVQKHLVEAEVIPQDSEWIIKLHTSDLEDVITQVVFLFGADNQLSGPSLVKHSDQLSSWKDGVLRCQSGEDWIEIEGGAFQHKIPAINGADQPGPGIHAVTVNLLSPYDTTFRIRLSGQKS